MIEINNLTKFLLDENFFIGVAKKVLKGEDRIKDRLSIFFVSPNEIQKINKKYRKINKPTDVLSFEKIHNLKDDYAQVIMCPAVVKRNIRYSKETFKKELTDVLIHGILHTLGYDHEGSKVKEKKMFKKQDYYLKKIISTES